MPPGFSARPAPLLRSPAMAKEPLVPRDRWNLDRIQIDIEGIRARNKQRFEMEQMSAITHLDPETLEIVGYRDVGDDEFWVRGHIPGRPIFPGVLTLEALAQLTSFYVLHTNPELDFVGFGGVDAVKFRSTIQPGDRVVLVGLGVSVRPRRAIFDTQAWVGDRLCVEARITGVRV